MKSRMRNYQATVKTSILTILVLSIPLTLSAETDANLADRLGLKTFEAGVEFARQEGIVPAPESNHAIAAVIREALACKESGEAKTLFFNLSGHGHFDMASYDKYFAGELEDFEYPEEAIKEALSRLPKNP